MEADSQVPKAEQAQSSGQPTKNHYRSWRKKYRKMKLKFDEKMKESSNLCKEEIKAKEIARRLQEQNDRMLDMLLDLNSSLQIPADTRFNVDEPTDIPSAFAPYEVETDDLAYLQRQLAQASQQAQEGHLNPLDFSSLEKALRHRMTTIGTKSLESLNSIPHTNLNLPDTAASLGDTLGEVLGISESNKDGYGYLTPDHADAFLLDLDRAFNEAHPAPPTTAYPPLLHPPTPEPTEKDLATNNPVSVQNYLRRYHPQIFLQDAEHALAEKTGRDSGVGAGGGGGAGSGGGGGGASKRSGGKRASKAGAAAAAGFEAKMELDPLDEELGIMPETTASGRKRARGEEDGSYRPKGGSSRPSKKRKAEGDGEGSGRGKKKVRGSNGGEA
ncbi:MAG: hypothetical protein M1821_007226 [Bathelium mastoideum]|nr:MAG: hypothetical protein M1821_007226 [Bathelium mastoideum]